MAACNRLASHPPRTIPVRRGRLALILFVAHLGGPVGLAQTPYFVFPAEAAGDRFGRSVGAAGDVNMDGVPDIVVGAWFANGAAVDSGKAYVYSGLDGSLLLEVSGEDVSDHLGYSVSGAGDVNMDGYADVIAGAHFSDAGGFDAGRAYVVSGFNNSLLHVFTGTNILDALGESVSGAGDVDGDQYDDVIVGAAGEDSLGSGAGGAYVYSGRTGKTLQTIFGEAAGDRCGTSVRDAGDVDMDGRPDLIVGSPGRDGGRGRARVFSGATGAVLHVFDGDAGGDEFGFAVGGAGDVDADGFADVIVGAPFHAGVGAASGRAYVFSGRTGDLLFAQEGGAAEDWLGYAVAGAGDVDGDGYADLVIGIRNGDCGGLNSGCARVVSGRSAEVMYALSGEAGGNAFGAAVDGVGDVNGDGFADFAVGAYLNGAVGSLAGRAYVFAPGPRCRCGDLNGSGVVELGDFATFATCFGSSVASPGPGCSSAQADCADFDGSGQVDLNDFATLAAVFGGPPDNGSCSY